jgi:ubiquitin conjugation factor E4 B
MLPSSRTIIDRSTIKSHLLSDSKDPFNRVPLAIEDVIPRENPVPSEYRFKLTHGTEPEFKARIETFLTERRKKPSGSTPSVDFEMGEPVD